MGDFNVDCLVISPRRNQLSELLTTFNLHRFDLPPTRISKDSSTSIDICCVTTNYKDDVDLQVINTGISDHTGQICNLNLDVGRNMPCSYSRRSLKPQNLDNLKHYLSNQDWTTVLECRSAENAYNAFIMTVTSALDATCPHKVVRDRRKTPLRLVYDNEVVFRKERFIEARDRYILSGKEEDKAAANTLKKDYDLKLRSLRREATANYISESSIRSKAIWNVINSERKSKQREHENLAYLMITDTHKVENPVELAHCFNTYFSSVAEETLMNISHERKTRVGRHVDLETPMVKLSPTFERELLNTINGLNNKTSAGLDEFSSVMVKHCRKELLTPLLYIINLSFSQGTFPSMMKSSKVIPVYKKGSKHEIGNFRPISLVSTFSKIIEKIVLIRITHHLESNNIRLNSQHGFQKKKSTITALVELVEEIVDKLEEGENISSIFLDLSKAFDCLSHELILTKLEELGFKGVAKEWFHSYLTGRNQLVELKQNVNGKVATHRSQLLPVARGVPQGSVLGPVIFVLFTYDLPSYTVPHSRAIMYADDTILIASSKSVEDLEVKTYIALNLAIEYCTMNDLVFNENKTKQVNVGNKRDEIIGCPGIQVAESTRHLGVVIDNRLTWVDHVDELCRRLSSAIFALRRIKSVSTEEALKITYHSLFESHLRYGVQLWGSASCHNFQRVLVLQKRALRVMAGLRWRESCREPFKEWHILTVVNIYILEVILLACMRGTPRNEDAHHYNTRHAGDFNLPLHHSRRFEMKPSYSGAKFFNLLPVEIKNSSPRSLKPKLNEWLLSRPFYSINEFIDWRSG